ncbi:MAG: patatin-like phospholipase family protein [Bacteroidota bacterium]
MPEKPFEIGLCMAGAVSAGAYTAGVMDYLIEALDTWESKRGQPGVPTHRVIIKAIGGASAGGMTGIIAASAFNNPITPIRKAAQNLMDERTENKFYHTWVDLLQPDMFPLMLDNSDMDRGKIYSLFNSNFIEEISRRAIQVDPDQWIEPPYVDNNMKFFTTLTNLEGLKYEAGARGNLTFNDYLISRHNDYGAFILNKSAYNNDGWIPVDFRSNLNTEVARNSAMATGAFPVGLRSRKLERKSQWVNDLGWHKKITDRQPVSGENYEALIVDGGTINNEPFERVRDLIKEGISQDFDKFKSTVLMIDPFPSEAEKFNVENDSMFEVIGGTLSAMLGQLRTKPEVLEYSLKENDAQQFQIAPTRKIEGEVREGSRAIACGFMGGFGGFIHKEFRIHDYFLGRANCERFLREYFTFPIDSSNSLFKEGYKDIPEDQFTSDDGKWRQIIPLFTPQAPEMYLPIFENGQDWPVRVEADIDRFKKALKSRSGKIVMNLGEYSWWLKLLLQFANFLFLKGKMAKIVIDVIKKSMKDHKLLK